MSIPRKGEMAHAQARLDHSCDLTLNLQVITLSAHLLRGRVRLRFLCAAVFGSALSSFADEVVFSLDLEQSPREISPLIYGLNDWSRNELTASIGYTLERMGGNRMTAYNWEHNFSNAGNDYLHHSDNLLVNALTPSEQKAPGAGIRLSVDHARAAGRPSLLTLQLAGYVAADGSGTVSESQAAPSSRWKEVVVRKDAVYSLNPDTSDEFVYLDEQVNFLIQRYGKASKGGVFAFSLDNEPALWASTHSRMHPAKPTVLEIIEKNAEVAAMVKDLDSSASVFGPTLYGWGAYEDLQDAPDWASYDSEYDWFVSAYLGEMRKRSELSGRRLLDALDLHYYPEVAVVTGKDGEGNDVYTRVTDNQSDSEALTLARLQAPRSLWDDDYVEESWVTQWSTNGEPLNVLPRVFSSIENEFPGTRLSISEYDFGGRQNYSGGLAQVDALGIFGREGVYAACFWGEVSGFIAPAFRLYRNYNGEGGQFGDVALTLTNPDPERFSSYAALHSATGHLHVILINKSAEAVEAELHVGESLGDPLQIEGFGFDEESGPNIETLNTGNVDLGSTITVALSARSAGHYIIRFVSDEALGNALRLRAFSVPSRFRMDMPTKLGKRYQLQRSADLDDWENVSDPFVGLGELWTRDFELEEDVGFWRVVAGED